MNTVPLTRRIEAVLQMHRHYINGWEDADEHGWTDTWTDGTSEEPRIFIRVNESTGDLELEANDGDSPQVNYKGTNKITLCNEFDVEEAGGCVAPTLAKVLFCLGYDHTLFEERSGVGTMLTQHQKAELMILFRSEYGESYCPSAWLEGAL